MHRISNEAADASVAYRTICDQNRDNALSGMCPIERCIVPITTRKRRRSTYVEGETISGRGDYMVKTVSEIRSSGEARGVMSSSHTKSRVRLADKPSTM